MPSQPRPNRLLSETSPYLKQHAYNPVDWYPWGPEALERARREDKPIFLSIGYSTCHWCHVMAHECFEHPGIAKLMNEHFINIKVDREERPDLDETYMTTVQLLTGRGGWPLSVFLAPDLRPFYAGTYFPPEDRGGLPGFPRLLLALSQAYRDKRDTVAKMGQEIEGRLKLLGEMPGEGQGFSQEELAQAAARLLENFDQEHGGFGGAPKFPRALELEFLLCRYRAAKDDQTLTVVGTTLEKMARGGIYDQLGGGFHRYTVDAAWVVPHFEKMLYDNALLAPLYLAHYQLTGSALSRRVAAETLDFVLRELISPQGGFYSAWDADSEGVEGKFYVWSVAEVEEVLGPDAALARTAFAITPEGNFEGRNILTFPFDDAELAARTGLSPEELALRLAVLRARLLARRESRVKPHRDEKIIAGQNGLMLSALARGAQVLGEPRYAAAAARGARFLLDEMWRDGRLFRIWAQGQVSIPGFLDDYAAVANAALDLYETDFDPAWLKVAQDLVAAMEDLFLDEADGTFFYVAKDQEAVLVRSKSPYDQAVPAGNSLAARGCWRLFRLTEAKPYAARWEAILRRFQPQALENPWGFAHYLTVAALSLLPPLDLTITGEPKDPRTQALLAAISRQYLPERRLVLKYEAATETLAGWLPFTRGYDLSPAKPLAYLCHHFTCRPPVADPEALAEELSRV